MDVHSGSSSFSSNSDDIESISSEEENVSSGKKNKGQDMKQPTTKIPSRKSPRDHGQTLTKVEDDAEDEEDMDSNDLGKESEEEKKEENAGKKRKREEESKERKLMQGLDTMPLPLSPILPQPHSEENFKVNSGEATREVLVNNRRKA